MPISCDTTDLATESKCLCFGKTLQDSVEIYLLCAWANGGVPPESGIILGNPDESWGFGNPDEGWFFGVP